MKRKKEEAEGPLERLAPTGVFADRMLSESHSMRRLQPFFLRSAMGGRNLNQAACNRDHDPCAGEAEKKRNGPLERLAPTGVFADRMLSESHSMQNLQHVPFAD